MAAICDIICCCMAAIWLVMKLMLTGPLSSGTGAVGAAAGAAAGADAAAAGAAAEADAG